MGASTGEQRYRERAKLPSYQAAEFPNADVDVVDTLTADDARLLVAGEEMPALLQMLTQCCAGDGDCDCARRSLTEDEDPAMATTMPTTMKAMVTPFRSGVSSAGCRVRSATPFRSRVPSTGCESDGDGDAMPPMATRRCR